MKASEARAISARNYQSEIKEIYDQILVSANLGKTSLVLTRLYPQDEEELRKEGFRIKKEETMMHGRPEGWLITVSW